MTRLTRALLGAVVLAVGGPGALSGADFFSRPRISTKAVASTSTHTVASGISVRLRVMFAATALRTPRTGVRLVIPRPVRESVA